MIKGFILLFSCVREQYFRLCKECDIVFHKSAIKRRHVRVPLVHIQTFPSENIATDDFGFPPEVKCFKWSEVIGNLGQFGDIQTLIAGYDEHPLKYNGIFWREAISCSILRSIKILIDDRKVVPLFLTLHRTQFNFYFIVS